MRGPRRRSTQRRALAALVGIFALTFLTAPAPITRLQITSVSSGNELGKLDQGYRLTHGVDPVEVPAPGNRRYADSTQAWPDGAFPPEFQGMRQIRTKAADSTTTGSTTRVSFVMNVPAHVFIIHDNRCSAVRPTWLTSAFTDTGTDWLIAPGQTGARYVSNTPLGPGTVNLGGNGSATCSTGAMYEVGFVEGHLPPDPALQAFPTAPTLGLTVQGSTSLRVQLLAPCSQGDGVLTYKLERTLSGAGSYTEIASGTSDAVFEPSVGYTMTGLTAATAYDVRGRCIDTTPDSSPYSAVVTATTQAGGGDVTAPTQPGNPTTSAITSSTITWTMGAACTDAVGVVEYDWHCGEGYENGTPVGGSSFLTERLVGNITRTGLAASSEYYCRLSCEDAAGNIGVISDRVFATTSADTTPPPSGDYEIILSDFTEIATGGGITSCTGACDYDTGSEAGWFHGSYYCDGPSSTCIASTEPTVVNHNGSRAMRFYLPLMPDVRENNGNWRSEIALNGPAAMQGQTGWEDVTFWYGFTRTVTCNPIPCPDMVAGQFHGTNDGGFIGAQASPVWGIAFGANEGPGENHEGEYLFYRRSYDYGGSGAADYGMYFGNANADNGVPVNWALMYKYSSDNDGAWALYYNCTLVLSESGTSTYEHDPSRIDPETGNPVDDIFGYLKFGAYLGIRETPHPEVIAIYDNYRVQMGASASLAGVSPTC